MLTAVTGLTWGDEGKEEILDLLVRQSGALVRCQGGCHSGFTVTAGSGGNFAFRLLPCGIRHPGVTNILGDGMVIDLDRLRHELSMAEYFHLHVNPDNLKLSERATICMPCHIRHDVLEEEQGTQGGMASVYSGKVRKKTLRLGDLLHLDEPSVQRRLRSVMEWENLILAKVYGQKPLSDEEALHWCRDQAAFFRPYITDTGEYLRLLHTLARPIVMESQLGTLRDIDYGVFPDTAPFHTLGSCAAVGAGIPELSPDHIVGVIGASASCIGPGPFPAGKAVDRTWTARLNLRTWDTTAARLRRRGPFDGPAARYGVQLQKPDQIVLTGLNALSPMAEIPVVTGYRLDEREVNRFVPGPELEQMVPVTEFLPGWQKDLSGCTAWENLPREAKAYVRKLEGLLGSSVHLISVEPGGSCFPRKRGSWLYHQEG